MSVRGIRGAITVQANETEEILAATKELLLTIVKENRIDPDDICSVFVTVTHDLNATFPARAIRTMPGWELVPLLCSSEIPVAGGLEKCIRLLLLVNTHLSPREVKHVYLGEAAGLRPDLVEGQSAIDRESILG
ncbi:chorismate mutase [Paenactinomyces guangxiensis]|uniref:chorismate mutase n=1 Tax=Paenactinomyces guangxiensis TaxID=1490290 RepID=A0A7W1WUD9_9BACL|nr:chorismate mutase [Paenactinomyces guangxiensis]MBA4496046.1 chorismate mutase [Paenactinomyces guangxiensis]MBH8593134.1 chorismate mutase [Paenactinomyces guangxiensis]